MRSICLTLAAVGVVLAQSGETGAADAPVPRHLLYLHGRIVQEQQNVRPRHPQYGTYELEGILAAFRARGFTVSGEIRPRSASLSGSADRVVEQVSGLLRSGVPADHITVVGGSAGAAIALLASTQLQEPEVRFCLLGICLSESVRELRATQAHGPSGRLLSIRETSDELTSRCAPWREDPKGSSPLVAREIVLDTGLRHGFLYRPLPQWVDQVVAWANAAGEHPPAKLGG